MNNAPPAGTGKGGDKQFQGSRNENKNSTENVFGEPIHTRSAGPTKPPAPHGDFDNPSAALLPLMEQNNWVNWRFEMKRDDQGSLKPDANGKQEWTKVPYQAEPGFVKARSNDRSTWRSFAAARTRYEKGGFDGVGYMILDSGTVAFDIDDCVDESGNTHPWAADLVGRAGSYVETTVSGRGHRIIGLGKGKAPGRKQSVPGTPVSIETYRNCARFIVVTLMPTPASAARLVNIATLADSVVAELDDARRERAESDGTTDDPPFDLDAAIADLPKHLKHCIETGSDPSPKKSKDLSVCFNNVVCWLHDLGWPSPEIAYHLAGKPIVPERYETRPDGVLGEVKRCVANAQNRPKRPRQSAEHWVDEPASAREKATEDEIAEAFSVLHADELKYDHDARMWFRFDGSRWRPDRQRMAFDYARQAARGRSSGKASIAAGVERFAQSDERHRADSSVWDRDPWLLATPRGTLDLRTGKLRDADPGDLITKCASVSPEVGEPALWLRFLDETFNGDVEMIAHVQRFIGYCLSGLTLEHAFIFAFGSGGNGKSVLLNTLRTILGDYATTSPAETFAASKSDRHPTDLARLRGARLVVASETGEGRAWDEARIKHVTGGDPVAARFMAKDFFEYVPSFKIMIAGNHAPSLQTVDDAIRRRVMIWPFLFRPITPDHDLESKLRAEHGRILNWAISGCSAWQAHGLGRPEAVRAATSDYLDNQNTFGQWLVERCEIGTGHSEPTGSLFASFKAFMQERGEEGGTDKAFSAKLVREGYQADKVRGVRSYRGLRLKRFTDG